MLYIQESRNNKITTYLFFAYWILMNGVKAVGLAEGQKLYTVGVALAFGCVIAKLIIEIVSDFIAKENTMFFCAVWAFSLLLIFLGIVIFCFSGQWAPLLYISVVIGMRNVNKNEVFRSGVVVWSICFIIKMLLALLGIREGFVLVHEKLGLGPIIRHNFDYTHPNVLQITYGFIMFGILYLCNQKGKELLKIILVMLIGSMFVFCYSLSYTGLFMNVAGYVIFLYAVNRKKLALIDKIMALSAFWVCPIIAVVIPLLTFDGMILYNYLRVINNFFHGRVLMSRQALQGGIHVFGTPVSESGVLGALDSSYLQLFTFDGIIYFFIILMAITWVIIISLDRNDWKNVALILAMAVGGLTEPFLFNTSYKNWMFVVLGCEIWDFISDLFNSKSCQYGNENQHFNIKKERCSLCRYIDNIMSDIHILALEKKRILLAFVTVGAVLFAAYRVVAYVEPPEIYVLTSHTDVDDREEYYIDEYAKQRLIDEGNKIYDYNGPSEKMYKFEGDIILYETIRTYMGYIVSGGIVGSIVFVIWSAWNDKRFYRKK